jgi:hypothetical protein
LPPEKGQGLLQLPRFPFFAGDVLQKMKLKLFENGVRNSPHKRTTLLQVGENQRGHPMFQGRGQYCFPTEGVLVGQIKHLTTVRRLEILSGTGQE